MAETQVKVNILISPESKQSLQGAAQDLKNLVTEIRDLTQQQTGVLANGFKQLEDSIRKTTTSSENLDKANKKNEESTKDLSESLRTLGEAAEFAAGGFLALEAVKTIKELADTAARAEVLATVLHQVGGNAGYTQQQLDQTDASVQKLGITAQSSRQSLSNLIAANIDLSHATILARAAQDLAVISGENSSDTFQRLIHAVEIRSTLDLRTLGINISLREAEEKYAVTLGKTAAELTNREQSQALLAEVEVQAVKRQGTYVAALGDVGKQITSLDRLQTNLSTTLGQNLLPAYLVLVQQLSLFIEEATATAQASNAASDGGQRLADTVRAIVVPVRELLSFLADHYQIVALLGTGFVLLAGGFNLAKVAALALTAPLRVNVAALVELSVAAYSNAAAFVAEGVAVAASTASAGPAAVATGLLATATEALAGALGLLLSPLGLISAALAIATGSLAYFLKQEKDAVPGAKWVDVLRSGLLGLKEDLRDLAILLGLVNGQLKFTPGTDNVAKEKKDRESREAASGDEATAKKNYENDLEAQTDFTKKLTDATRSGTGEEITAATQAYKAGHDRLAASEKAFTESLKTISQDPGRVLKDQQEAAQKKAELQAQLTAQDAVEAQAKLLGGDSFAQDGQLLTKAFTESREQFQEVLKEFNEGGKNDVNAAQAVSEAVQKLALTVKTPEDLKQLRDVVKKVGDTNSADASVGGDLALALAKQQVDKAELAKTAPLTEIQRAQIKDTQQVSVQDLEAENQKRKIARDLADKEEADAFGQNKVTIDKYYADRIERIRQGNADEQKLSEAKVRQLKAEQGAPGLTTQQRRDFNPQIDKVRVDQGVKNDQAAAQVSEQENAKKDEQRQINQKIAEEAAQLRRDTQGLAGQLDEITEKYKKQLDQQHGQAPELLKQLESAEKLKVIIEDQNKKLEEQQRLYDGQARTRDAAVAQQRALLDANKSLSPGERQNSQNDLIRQQQENALAERSDALNQLAAEQSQRDSILGSNPAADVSKQNDAIDNLRNKITGLNTQVISLGAGIKTYGETIKEQFGENVSSTLTELITNFRNAQSTILGFAKNLEKSLVEPAVSNLTSKFLNNLTTGTSQGIKGPDGKPVTDITTGKAATVDNTSVFARLGSLFGDKDKKQLGATPTNPLNVAVTNFQKPPGTGQGTGTAPYGQQGASSNSLEIPGLDQASSASSIFKSASGGDFASAGSGLLGLAGQLFGGGSSGVGFSGAQQAQQAFNASSLSDSLGIGFARGGVIHGPGTGTSDSIMAMLSHGEHITNAQQTSKYLPLLTAINNGQLDRLQSIALPQGLKLPKFAQGGLVGGGGFSGGGSGGGGIQLQIHPDMARVTLGDWFQSEIARQTANR